MDKKDVLFVIASFAFFSIGVFCIVKAFWWKKKDQLGPQYVSPKEYGKSFFIVLGLFCVIISWLLFKQIDN